MPIASFSRAFALFGLVFAAMTPAMAQTYDPLPWHEVALSQEIIDLYYPEAEGVMDMDLPREPRIYFAEIDHPIGTLTISMWVGLEFCGINNCAIKIFDAEGRHLGGANTCDAPEYITIDPSHQYLRLCSDTARPVANLFWNQAPPTATTTLAAWQGADVVYLNHNGSVMAVSPAEGIIRYERVRDGLRGTIADGTVLFRGEPWQPGGAFRGTAYTFRKGCDPAPYDVAASYESHTDVLTLKGEAPVRQQGGCTVTGYTADSGNAVLEFHPTFD
ncbi:hypothetical protein DMC47_04390 [Nostoc sp. 3335mG]|nr:hypothetical protein DMC47_04390 [Nostoc sp. 3335mG]